MRQSWGRYLGEAVVAAAVFACSAAAATPLYRCIGDAPCEFVAGEPTEAAWHCWPDRAKTWQSCWWSGTPPVEIELRGPGALGNLPPPAIWAAGAGRCQNVVSYALNRSVTPPGEEPRAYARRRIVVHCDGEPVHDKVIEP